MKHRKRLQPAPTTTKLERLRPLEADARQLYFIQKEFLRGGADAAIRAVSASASADCDPSAASMSATSIIVGIDKQLNRDEEAQRGRASGGSATAKWRKGKAQVDYVRICTTATELLNSGMAKRNIAGVIQLRTGFSRPKINRLLEQHPSGNWKKMNAR